MKLFQRYRKTTKADRQGRRKAKKADRSLKRLERKYNRQHKRADNLNDNFDKTKDKISALGGDLDRIDSDYNDGNVSYGLGGLFLRHKSKKSAFGKDNIPEVEESENVSAGEEIETNTKKSKSNLGLVALIIAGAKLFKLF